MDINENTIIDILQNGECVTLECKRAKSEVPKSVWETYSAFANTIGGVILLGIENIYTMEGRNDILSKWSFPFLIAMSFPFYLWKREPHI